MYKLWETMHKLWENKVVRYCIISILIITTMCFVLLYGLSWIPVQEIDFTKDISTIKSDDLYTDKQGNTDYITNDTVTVNGKIYHPWFSNGYFVGNIDFENNSNLSTNIKLSESNVKIGSSLYDPSDGYIYGAQRPTYIVEYWSEQSPMISDAVTLRLMFDIDNKDIDDCKNLYVEIHTKEKLILAKEE